MFEVCDKVRCVDDFGASGLSLDSIYTVIEQCSNGNIRLFNDAGVDWEYPPHKFELAIKKKSALQTETKQQHKHRDLIIAWADGAVIECRNDEVNWFKTKNPSWCLSMEYRVKPEPKPDQSRTMFVELNPRLDNAYNKPNLKLTFDGETGKLKATEIIDND